LASRLPISTAPHTGTLIRFWCRSEVEPMIGYWSRTFIGCVTYHEDVPLIRHDVTGWEPIADQAAARAIPLEKVRQAGATTTVLGTVKAARTRKLVRAIDKPVRLQTLDDAFNAGGGGHGGAAEAGRWRNRRLMHECST
jgi:hypothetical protein